MRSLLYLFVALFVSHWAFGQNVTFVPATAPAGGTVAVHYEGAPDVEGAVLGQAFVLTGDEPQALDINLRYTGSAYEGEFTLPANAKAAVVTVTDEKGENLDNNDGKGYSLLVCQTDGKTPVAGAVGSLAKAYYQYTYYAGVDRNFDLAMEYLQQEFKQNPASKTDGNFLTDYANLASRTKNETAQADARSVAESLARKKNATEEDQLLAYYVLRALRDTEEAEKQATMIRKEYPKGILVRDQLAGRFYSERELEKKIDIYREYEKKYAKDAKTPEVLEDFAATLAVLQGGQGNWQEFDRYFAMLKDPQGKAGTLNNLAWTMSGESLEGEATDLERAAKMSKQSLDLLEKARQDVGKEPSVLSPSRERRDLQDSYGMYSDTYALLLYKLGKKEEALRYQTISCEQNQFGDGDMNQRYAVYLEEAKGMDAAEPFLAGMIRDGKATSKMKEQHRRIFLATKSLEAAYDDYLVELERSAKERFREEVAEKIIDLEAPNFSLVNLEGKTVQLSDLQGKTVVLDFWATWCGPCKASFPGMQRAVNNFHDDDKVVFLFIDTWENAGDKEKNASDFITKMEYTFNVLMDNDNKVVADYKVEGIPTKFVIDPTGRIRFKSVGFSGNDEELVTELETMIELAGKVRT